MKNYHVLKKQYQSDIELLNNKLDEVIKKRIYHFAKSNSEYTSDLISIYHRSPEYITTPLFTWDTLNELEIIRNIRTAGFEIHHVNLFIQLADKLAELHVDDGADPRHVSINLPLRGCKGSNVLWIRPDQFTPGVLGVNGLDASITNSKPRTIGSKPSDLNVLRDSTTWDIVDSVSANQAIILKTDTWHAVDNRGNLDHRCVFAIRLVKNPGFEETINKLEPTDYETNS